MRWMKRKRRGLWLPAVASGRPLLRAPGKLIVRRGTSIVKAVRKTGRPSPTKFATSTSSTSSA